MPLSVAAERRTFGRSWPVAIALAAALALSGCSSMGMSATRIQGYAISDSALAQIRPGQSKQLVAIVLGSPQTQSEFGEEEAWYYVETTVDQTAFGLSTVRERKVLAIYFDSNDRVVDKALYGLEDGRVFAIESRRTPSFGEDRTFIESIIQSF